MAKRSMKMNALEKMAVSNAMFTRRVRDNAGKTHVKIAKWMAK